jgi:hypothetical protein
VYKSLIGTIKYVNFYDGDFGKTLSIVIADDGEEEIASVKSRLGNYVILDNGVRFHVLDDRKKSTMIWRLPDHGITIKPILGKE